MTGKDQIEALCQRLEKQPRVAFPETRAKLLAPKTHGVYVIRNKKGRVVHVGRIVRGKWGLHQRLNNHLEANSSFVIVHLSSGGKALREGYTFQYLEVPNERKRALLEHFATAWHCPADLGLEMGEEAEVMPNPAVNRTLHIKPRKTCYLERRPRPTGQKQRAAVFSVLGKGLLRPRRRHSTF